MNCINQLQERYNVQRNNTTKALRRGFTLIEMLLAISIFVLVITSIAPVFFTTQDRIGLENKAKEIGAVIFDTRTKSLQGFGSDTKAIVLSTDKNIGAMAVSIPTGQGSAFEQIQQNPALIQSYIQPAQNLLLTATGEQKQHSNPFYTIDSLEIPGNSTSSPASITILFEPVSSSTYVFADGNLLQNVTDIKITLASIVRPHIKKSISINPLTGITQ